jgi:DNA-binding NarL/FixJ family response regulator
VVPGLAAAIEWNEMKILVADDHWVSRAGLLPLLEELDDEVSIEQASSYEETLALARGKQDFDLVLLDLLMPEMDPFSGIQAIRECAPTVPLVVMSIVDHRPDVLHAIERGAMGFIPKTASKDEILYALRRVLSGEIWIPREEQGSFHTQPAIARFSEPRGGNGEDPFEQLTARQRDVLKLIAQGQSNADIAEELGLSQHTVKLHVSGVLKALKASNRTEAAMMVANRASGRKVS